MKLRVLGLGSGILVLLAVAAFAVNQWITAPSGGERVGQALLTGVDSTQVRTVAIESAQDTVHLTSPDGVAWHVAEQDGFPVDTKKIKGLFFKLSNEKLAHKVTENAERLADLGLLTREENGGKLEKDKTARVLRFLGAGDTPLFALLLGNERRTQGGAAFGGAYVRYPGSPASYLISETVLADFRPQDWIDTQVLELEADKTVQSIRVERSGQRAVHLSRDKPEAPWTMAGLPGPQLSQDAAKRVAAQLAGLDVFKVRKGDTPAAQVGRGKTGRVEFALFDKRRFSLDVGEAKAEDDFRYLTIRADLPADVQDAALQEQVQAFNTRFGGRLLAVYDWDGARMLQDFAEYQAK